MNLSSLFRINRLAVLEFYDTRPLASSKHASAVNAVMGEDLGIGLMKHYFENQEKAAVTILDETCVPGTSKGNRLDRWLSVQWPDDSKRTLFQVEIKNWSSHSLGGRRLALDAEAEKVKSHKEERWSKEWDADTRELLKEQTRKVLFPMRAPRSVAAESVSCIKPALCMWDAMHSEGGAEPSYSAELPGGHHFLHLWVFSMSAYLRNLDAPFIEIEMPDAFQRLQWLNRFTSAIGNES